MITILHGENQAASRQELERIKAEAGGEIIVLDGKVMTETDFVQATQAESLFKTPRIIIVENYFLASKNTKLSLKGISCDLIFWEEKKISEKIIKEIEKTADFRERQFKEETAVFRLMDSLFLGNGQKCVPVFRQCLKTGEPQYLFLMLVRQFRLMLNPIGLPPWQKEKVSRQAKSFGQGRLACLYRELLEIDFQNKSGRSPLDLSAALELFLISL